MKYFLKNLRPFQSKSFFLLFLIILTITNISMQSQVFGEESPAIKSAPEVLVSITPFHALVAGVMCGVKEPRLLLQPGASPHHYSLRPSEVAALHKADIIFFGGPDLESFLEKPLSTLSRAKIVRLDKTPKLQLLNLRTEVDWLKSQHDNHDHDHHHTGTYDMHFWLDPKNAIVLVDYITEILAKEDPLHANQYKKNSENLKQELKALDLQLQQKLAKVKKVPYLVFHDAYQYFEERYGLKSMGAITLHPELPISLERLKHLQNNMINHKTACVFSEPQFKPKIVETLVEGTNIKTGVIDPLGDKTSHCAKGYFTLLENIAKSLEECL